LQHRGEGTLFPGGRFNKARKKKISQPRERDNQWLEGGGGNQSAFRKRKAASAPEGERENSFPNKKGLPSAEVYWLQLGGRLPLT